jgi:hypothetical protein
MLAATAILAQSPRFADEETSFRLSTRGSEITLALEHSGAKPLTIVFPSSQDFDFSIWDSRGNSVYTWSADKVFLPVVRRIELSGKKTWTVPLPVENLRPGRYLVDGWLTTEEGRVFRAIVPLTVDQP